MSFSSISTLVRPMCRAYTKPNPRRRGCPQRSCWFPGLRARPPAFYSTMGDAERLEAVYGPVAKSTRCKTVRRETVESVVKLAVELAREGREGRKIGTLFVIGDVPEVLERSRPLLLDPLYGHAADVLHVERPD